jgi:hypothetical protein
LARLSLPEILSINTCLKEAGGRMLVKPAKAAVTRQLLIVSRSERERYAYLQYVFDSETGDVILDRRVQVRRRRDEPVSAERRREDRRQRDITTDLQVFGWALVRRAI